MHSYTRFTTLCLSFLLVGNSATISSARAQDDAQRAIVVIVGDADRFNIGQNGYCGKRSEIPNPSNAQFRVHPDKRTYFYIKASIETAFGITYCEGDYSFIPEATKVHIIRYSMAGDNCLLELFQSVAGEAPTPANLIQEEHHSCLSQ